MLEFKGAISVRANVHVRLGCGHPGGVGDHDLVAIPQGDGGGPSSLG